MGKTVLIVDDDPTQRRLLQAVVEKSGFSTLQADNGDRALEMALGADGKNIHVMLLDLVMPGRDGMEVLTDLQQKRPELPVIVLTGKGSIDAVVSAMQLGARDFVVKPASPERIIVSLRNALEINNLAGEVTRLKKSSDGSLSFKDLIGSATTMRSVIAMGERGARANIPILITGESGVGKEVIARAIQGASERAGQPFITVNCGAIPENLGTFREDLYYRLNVFPIQVPSLRDRAADIPALTDHFIKRFNAQERLSIQGAAKETLDMLGSFNWPGNVRQLENAIFRAMILSDGVTLQPHDFPQISGLAPLVTPASSDTLRLSEHSSSAPAADEPVHVLDREGHLRTLVEIERDLIEFAIGNYSGHMSEVARRLGIGRSTLYRKVREHGVDVDTVRTA